MSDVPKEVSVPVWAKVGVGIVRRSCLEADHPLSTYNYVKNELGLDPSEYGIPSDMPYSMVEDGEA